jgi:hypothetical protein
MAYWSCWAEVPVRFAERERGRVPSHWLIFGGRRSALTDRNQKATNPPNAILNYLFAIGEAEARIALMREGLDPGLGLIHADRPERDNLALDVLEGVRPAIEAYVLTLLARETFRRADFFETRDGNCRLLPPLTERLAATADQWASAIAPLARRLARTLERVGAAGRADPVRSDVAILSARPLPALLRNPTPTAAVHDPNWRPPKARICRHCGVAFQHARNLYCATCLPLIPAIASQHARAALRARQAAGDPNASPERRRKLAHARTENAKAIRAWEAAHPARPTPHVFMQTIWPQLDGITAQAVREATGLSISYCRRVLRGQYVPHPMHWAAIRTLTESAARPARRKETARSASK